MDDYFTRDQMERLAQFSYDLGVARVLADPAIRVALHRASCLGCVTCLHHRRN